MGIWVDKEGRWLKGEKGGGGKIGLWVGGWE